MLLSSRYSALSRRATGPTGLGSALLGSLLPGTDVECILEFEFTETPKTYRLSIKNSGSGSALNVANRFVDACKKGGQGSG